MTTKNSTGDKDALGRAIHSLDDRLRQLQSITPGAKGGGTVEAPFSIGGYTFGIGTRIDLRKLADIGRPGDRWEAEPYRPTLSQGASTNITYTFRYSDLLLGDEVVWNFWLDPTAAGTAASAVKITLPRVAFYDIPTFVGQVQIYDASTATRYSLEAETTDEGTAVSLGGSSTGNNLWGANPNIAIASSDQIRGMLRYRPRILG